MGGQVEVVLGDMFEGPSDLIVIPCSTAPSITWFVADRLKRFDIPKPDSRMRPGEVRFFELSGVTQLAPYAAFAASVLQDHSKASWIEGIAATIGGYARETPTVQLIACPLLGTGAGGLRYDRAADALIDGFTRTAPEHATLRLFALDSIVYRSLGEHVLSESPGGRMPTERLSAPSPPRVFISYTRSSDAHAEWVKLLATRLRQSGIEARLDVWHLGPGMDLPQWMANELDMADRVLIVGDELYAQKSDRRHGGVGWEMRIIQGDLLLSQASNPDKYIPIVVTPKVDDGLPVFLQGTYSLHWPHDMSETNAARLQEDLVRAIFRVREEAPPVGRPPSFVLPARHEP